MSANETARPADAGPTSWIDDYFPVGVRPYLRLARADRPIGIWLLLWPCWWSLSLAAAQGSHELSLAAVPLLIVCLQFMVLFAVGAAVMRAAGCVYNDIVDRDIDARVARTAGRPIPSGQVSVSSAWQFLAVLLLTGLLVLLCLNSFSVILGAASLLPVAIYPFMKRFTNWPQAFLGLTFNWGALLGWSALLGGMALAPVCLFVGCIFWTLGYDTIYAHQDKEDDALLGVGSTALALGDATSYWLIGFYSLAWVFFALAGYLVGLSLLYFVGLLAVAGHFGWQINRLNIADSANCLVIFKANRDLGLIMFAAILAGLLFT